MAGPAYTRPPVWDATSALAPLKTGYLIKQGEKYKTWKRRWFELSNSTLAYYKNAADISSKGVIPLQGRMVVPVPPSTFGRDRCFALSHPVDRTYYIQAPSADELASWMLAVDDAIAFSSHPLPSPHRPASLFTPPSTSASNDASDASDDASNDASDPPSTALGLGLGLGLGIDADAIGIEEVVEDACVPSTTDRDDDGSGQGGEGGEGGEGGVAEIVYTSIPYIPGARIPTEPTEPAEPAS